MSRVGGGLKNESMAHHEKAHTRHNPPLRRNTAWQNNHVICTMKWTTGVETQHAQKKNPQKRQGFNTPFPHSQRLPCQRKQRFNEATGNQPHKVSVKKLQTNGTRLNLICGTFQERNTRTRAHTGERRAPDQNTAALGCHYILFTHRNKVMSAS